MARKNPAKLSDSTRRNVFVFASLVGGLTLTTVLLMVLSPPPLSPEHGGQLLAVDEQSSLERAIQPAVAPRPGQWKYIYIHHSKTVGGPSAAALASAADHFVIDNADGADGQLLPTSRWQQQIPPAPPPGFRSIDPAYISICLTGDLDRNIPTTQQIRQLTQLVAALRSQYNIRAEDVLLLETPDSPAAIGRYFPAAAFREQLAQ